MAMDQSILNSVKKVLGLDAAYTAFDQDILTGINAALSTAEQLGVGRGYLIDDENATWYSLELDTNTINLLRTYVNLRCRLLFDPPTSSFLKDAFEKQLKEFEWRLNHGREYALGLAEDEEDTEITDDYIIFDGGTPQSSEDPPDLDDNEVIDEFVIIDGGTP